MIGKNVLVSVMFAIQTAIGAQKQPVRVTVVGEGLTQEAACRDAMRKAVERGAGNEISSRSHVENAVLIRDVIFARADGLVADHEVLETGDSPDGAKFCRIRATVKPGAVAETWGEVQNVLAQVGRPGIMVYVRERIDGEDQRSSIAEAAIEHLFLDAGFQVYAREQLDAIARKSLDDAIETGNSTKAQQIAKRFATDIFITGSADASAAGVRILAGQQVAMYNADGTIKMYYTDTGDLLASEPLTNCRGGVRSAFEQSRQGGTKAIENCAKDLAEACYWSVMRACATRISAGHELQLEVEGLTFAEAVELEKQLRAIDPDRIRDVTRSFSKRIATFRIRSTWTAADLAERLVKKPWASRLRITDQQTNRIEAKWIAE